MGGQEIVSLWTKYLKSEVFTQVGVVVVRALGMFSVMMSEARHCQSSRIASHGFDEAKPASRRRRWERLLANRRFEPQTVQQQLIQAVWRNWQASQALLLLDETPRANALRCLRVSVAYRRRAIPLVTICYRPHRLPAALPQLVQQALQRAVTMVPPEVRVIILADRGLAWPAVIDWCVRQGHHYLLRLQGQTRVRLADGRIVAARDLTRRPGCRPFAATADLFRKAGWRRASVIAQWPRGCREPWLLVTDQSACAGRWRQYARRMWIEQAFRDEKSHGFQWQLSRVNDPKRAERLLTVMSLAMLLVLSLGTWLIKRGHRRRYDPRRHRRLSLFQLGLLTLHDLLTQILRNHPNAIYLCPT